MGLSAVLDREVVEEMHPIVQMPAQMPPPVYARYEAMVA